MSFSSSLIWSFLIIILILAALMIGFGIFALVYYRNLKRSKRRLELLFDHLSDALVLFDQRQRIVKVNEAACRLLGYSEAEFSELAAPDIISKDSMFDFQDCANESVGADGCSIELNIIAKDGGIIPAEMTGGDLKINGKHLRLVGLRDITRLKQKEQELQNKHIALTEILAQIEKEKIHIRREARAAISEMLIPALQNLINEDNTVNIDHYDLLRDALLELSQSMGGSWQQYSRLSLKEIEICRLLKNRASTKEIAQSLNITPETVAKHRKKIRKKLGISKKNINLTLYLKDYDA